MNNFDRSTSGVNLQLSVCWDSNLSTIYFEENFKRLDNDQFLFVDCGNFTDDFDFTDLDNYSFSKNDCLTLLSSQYNRSELLERSQYLFEKTFSKLCKQELIEYIENEIFTDFTSDGIIDLYQKYFTPLFESLTVTGHCQGDVATVIFTHESMKEYNYKNRGQFLSMMRKYFGNLFYNAPLYCRLTIDNDIDDFYLDDFQKDQYTYDKDEILEHAEKNIKHDKKSVIMEFLNDNLPEYPDYIY